MDIQDLTVSPREKNIKASIISYLTQYVAKKVRSNTNNPIKAQSDTFKYLIKSAIDTDFGCDHNFKSIHSYQDWVKNIPVRDYEGLKPYLNKVFSGQKKCALARSTYIFCLFIWYNLRVQKNPCNQAFTSVFFSCWKKHDVCVIIYQRQEIYLSLRAKYLLLPIILQWIILRVFLFSQLQALPINILLGMYGVSFYLKTPLVAHRGF